MVINHFQLLPFYFTSLQSQKIQTEILSTYLKKLCTFPSLATYHNLNSIAPEHSFFSHPKVVVSPTGTCFGVQKAWLCSIEKVSRNSVAEPLTTFSIPMPMTRQAQSSAFSFFLPLTTFLFSNSPKTPFHSSWAFSNSKTWNRL